MSSWPYLSDAIELRPAVPSWDCPEGICVCHPVIDPQAVELAVMLCDENGVRMPGARCRVLLGGRVMNRDQPHADASGWILVTLHREVSSVVLEWAPSTTPQDERSPYRLRYQVKLGDEEAGRYRLANLGFIGGRTLRENVEAFQRQYGLRPVSGELADIEDTLRAFHDEARLPPVPADQAPNAAVPLMPPPPPPPTEGNDKLGDGEPPGQGTARSDMVPREIRLLDFERNPARGARCQVQVATWRYETAADAEGVARFRAPRGAATCDANWQLDEARYERRAVEMLAHHESDTFVRLGNLGFSQSTIEQRVIAYQRELRQDVTGREEHVAEQVKEWHDGGSRPGANPPVQTENDRAESDIKLAAFIPPQIPHPFPPGLLSILSTVGPVVIGPTGPFLVVKPPRYQPDALLSAQFATFATKLPKAALSVTELSNAKRPYFGFNDDQVHYSASTCKSIALVTASLLLSALRRYAKAVGLSVPAKKLLAKAAADFRDPILAEAQAHKSLKPASDSDLSPNYNAAFTVTAAPSTATSGSHQIAFSSGMERAIHGMMFDSSNPHSATVIGNVGFGYIHGALVHAGLFDRSSDAGLWLAGDYQGGRTARRIAAVNDLDTAQGATTRTFVSMLDIALQNAFPNTNYVADKLALSRDDNPSWLTEPDRDSREKKGFFDERGKIGDGNLKGSMGGHFVFSELIEFRHIQSGRRFLVSYQNSRDAETIIVSDIVLDGLSNYVKATTP